MLLSPEKALGRRHEATKDTEEEGPRITRINTEKGIDPFLWNL